jgi:hypothetical protein
MGNLVSRRELNSITKITSKRNVPEIITFRYAASAEQQVNDDERMMKSAWKQPNYKMLVNCDKVYLADAGDATKNIKLLIMKALNMYDPAPINVHI